jgi:hypothetical protein
MSGGAAAFIAECQLPIANLFRHVHDAQSAIGNWKSAMISLPN